MSNLAQQQSKVVKSQFFTAVTVIKDHLLSSSVNGMWGSWTTWSACSQTCGYGVRERNRYCDNPKPAYNGTTCVGNGYQKIRCHAYYPCPGM